MIAFSFNSLDFRHSPTLIFIPAQISLNHTDICLLFIHQSSFCYDNNNLFLSFYICNTFIITKYDNNVITIFDNNKYIYPFLSIQIW